MSEPTGEELRAYLSGGLSPERFAAIEQWLDAQPPEKIEQLFHELGQHDTGKLHDVSITAVPEGFITEAPAQRLRVENPLGAGGMAVVAAAQDRMLDRVIALKTLKPRQVGESLEQYQVREAAFRREAAITAGLEHPSIVPVYDVGRHNGQLAFTMKKLSGELLADVVTHAKRTQIAGLESLLRVAEAVAYAHDRGVVHRDLTPHNILIANYGAVYVLDWGIAAHTGHGGGVAVGTLPWTAPEQKNGVPADPRMDVYALGQLLFFILTCKIPANPIADEQLLAKAPSALTALWRHCAVPDPAERYADAGVVAAELRRYLDEGLTLAQQAGPLATCMIRLRRSAQARLLVSASGILLIVFIVGWWWTKHVNEQRALQRIEQLAREVSTDQVDALRVALAEVRNMAQEYPRLVRAKELAARWQALNDLAEQQQAEKKIRQNIEVLLLRWRRSGPWAEETDDWKKTLQQAVFALDKSVPELASDLHEHPLRTVIVQAFTHLWYAAKANNDEQLAIYAADIIEQGGPTAGWRSLGTLLKDTEFQAHQPIFCPCAASDGALADPQAAAVILSLYGPDDRLIAFARRILTDDPGAFWPLIASARAALNANDLATAERQAFIASGSDSYSIYPHIILAYVGLARGDQNMMAQSVARGLQENPAHSELLVLQAVVFAHQGKTTEAQTIVNQLDPAHLNYHIEHRVGHAMERGVAALITAGLTIPPAPAKLGPLVPHRH
jgi:serine/threonine protein kinase